VLKILYKPSLDALEKALAVILTKGVEICITR
jgi:hypothetical protein